jgi:hypothetical protein
LQCARGKEEVAAREINFIYYLLFAFILCKYTSKMGEKLDAISRSSSFQNLSKVGETFALSW